MNQPLFYGDQKHVLNVLLEPSSQLYMIKKNKQQNQDQDALVGVSGKSIEKRTTTKKKKNTQQGTAQWKHYGKRDKNNDMQF